MRVKKFRAPSISEAVNQVKREWGPEALILHTKKVRRVTWPLFWRSRWEVEVTAAYAEQLASREEGTRTTTPISDDHNQTGSPVRAGEATPDQAGPAPYQGRQETGEDKSPEMEKHLRAEMQQMREMMAYIWRQIQPEKEYDPAGLSPSPPLYPENVEPIYSALIHQELEPTLARCLTDALLDQAEGKGPGLLRQEAAAAIERLLGRPEPVDLGKTPRVVALVGPTGVGKTTTLAKLAAHFSLRERKKVAMVTVDTFRVGAVDQLRAYADIAGLPCYVATNPTELSTIIERLSSYDLILIDTAGRSHRDEVRMSELTGFWAARRPDEIHLVISATARYSDALEILDRYREPGFDRLIFTKLDETRHHGLMVNVSVVSQRPLSYVTTGQQVPEDIAVARAGDLAKLLV